MKKRLISVALVLVLVVALAVPVLAVGESFSFNGATVSLYANRSSVYASASTTLSADGGMVQSALVLTLRNNQTGKSELYSPVGPMDLRESHMGVSPPAGHSFYPGSSLHYYTFWGQENTKGYAI